MKTNLNTVSRFPISNPMENGVSLFPPPTVILGPTTVGKTEVAFGLARRLGADVVNADKFYLYNSLPHVTGQSDADQYPELRPWQAAAISISRDWNFHPSLRVSLTGKCNSRCEFCHNEGNTKNHNGLPLKFYQRLACQGARIGLRSVKFTGGEPTLREDLAPIVSAFRVGGFEDISIVTNGIAFTPALQVNLREAGLDRATVSLHTLEPEQYVKTMRIPSANLARTLVNLEHAARNFPGALKLNVVFEAGGNYPGEVVKLVRLASSLNATLSVLSPVSNSHTTAICSGVRQMVLDTFHVEAVRSHHKRGIKVDTLILAEGGAVELDDFRTEDAVAAKHANSYCARCPVKDACTEGPYALRVTAKGNLKPCLKREDNEVQI